MIHYKSEGFLQAFYSVFPVQLGSAVFSNHCLFHATLASAITIAINHFYDTTTLHELIRHPSVYFSGYSSCLGFLLVYRANLAYQRYWEARTRITQMTSKLRDVAIQVATFVQKNYDDAASWKSTQLRRLALYNSLALMELRENGNGNDHLEILRSEGIIVDDEMGVLQATGNKPALVMVWLVDAWVVRQMADEIDVPPPVLSRTFQLLSEASLERDHIHKIRDTPFPFPFAQVCSLLLLFWCLTLPVIVAVYVDFVWLGAAISFLGVLSLFSINGVSSELECPFDDTANDLSLEYFKDEFTDSMAEMMAWLAEKSNGNVAGSLEAKPAEEPWGLIKAQIAMREKHGGKLMETESRECTRRNPHHNLILQGCLLNDCLWLQR